MSTEIIARVARPVKPAVVYAIECAATGGIYIGSTSHLYERWCQHKTELRAGTHRNLPMQEDATTHGLDTFSVRTLEECTTATARTREQHWIRQYPDCYNLRAARRVPSTPEQSLDAWRCAFGG